MMHAAALRVARLLVGAGLGLLLAGCPRPQGGGGDASISDAATTAPPDAGAVADAAVGMDAAGTGDAAAGGMDAGTTPDAAAGMDAAAPGDAAPTGDAAVRADAGVVMDAGGGVDDAGRAPWQRSFSSCWNTSSCRRALLLSHGGDWGGQVPYGSHAAHVAAFEHGADAVKVDVRVTQDGVPMVAHSSPIELWESLGCSGQRIEEMTAAQVAACRMLPSTTETFPRLDDTINWARGRINLMFTVKERRDFPAAMALAQQLNALDFVLLEVDETDITTTLPPVPGWDAFFYDVQLSSLAQLDTFLMRSLPPGVILLALDLNEFTEPEADITAAITAKVLPAGKHALTPSHKTLATVQDQAHRYSLGYDVIYTYNLGNGVTARTQENINRGIAPP